MMPDPDPQIIAKVENLRKTLHHHNYRYYVFDEWEIKDSQFAGLEPGGSKTISALYCWRISSLSVWQIRILDEIYRN
jgi:hypothetical protein